MSFATTQREMPGSTSADADADADAGEDGAFADALFGPETGAGTSGSATRFGDYELLEVLGRGGMGVVYRAWQISLNRVVAVKMIPFGALASDEAVRRFKAEAEAAGQLRHPNIINIHEIGVRDGQHYFSMDYVDGGTLTEALKEGPWPARKAAACVRTVSGAVEHAHASGILHRDLKPSNILLDTAGEPHVVDFGLSRRIAGDSSLTQTGQVLGSPNYMPPEQASGGKAPATAASDVYSLGAVLYHALTGRPPFQAESVDLVLARVLRDEPVPPRLLNPAVPRDLETVCLKCLEKEPSRRYPAARDLAEELGRVLDDVPVRAKPAGAPEKAWRWCRRRPALALALTALAAALIVGAGGVLWQWRRAESATTATRRNLYAADMGLAYQAFAAGDRGRARQLLEPYRPASTPPPNGTRIAVAGGGDAIRVGSDVRPGWEWRYLWRECQTDELATLGFHPGAVVALDYSPDGRWLASGDVHGNLTVWEVAARRGILTTNLAGARVDAVAFSPDGRWLAQATARRSVYLWDTRSWLRDGEPLNHPEVTSLAFSPDGRHLATVNGADVTLWNFETRRPVKVIPGSTGRRHPRHASFSIDGRVLAIGDENGVVVFWDWEADKARGGWRAHRPPAESDRALESLTFSSVNRMLITAGQDRTVRLWQPPADFRVQSAPSFRLMSNHADVVRCVAFSKDGRRLVSAGQDQTLRLWDVATQTELASWHAHSGGCLQARFSPDGESIASAGFDGAVRLWAAGRRPGDKDAVSHLLPAGVKDSLVLSDPPCLALELHDGSWRKWHLPSLEEQQRGVLGSNGTFSLKAIGSGTILELGGRAVRLRRTAGGLPDLELAFDVGPILALDLARDQNAIVVSGVNGLAVRRASDWKADVRRWSTPHSGSGRHVRLTRDGATVVTVQEADGAVGFWDVATGRQTALGGSLIGSAVMAFSRDGDRLVTAGQGTSLRGYDVPARREEWSLDTSGAQVTAVGFSPDGTRVAGGMPNGRLVLWELVTRREVASLQAHRGMIYSLAFIDDDTLVTATREEVRIWRAPQGR